MEHVHRGMKTSIWAKECGFPEEVVEAFTKKGITWDDVKSMKELGVVAAKLDLEDEYLISKIKDMCEHVKIHESAATLGQAKKSDLRSDEDWEIDPESYQTCQEVPGFPGLWIGGYESTEKKDFLKHHHITHILTVANYLDPAHENDFNYKIIHVMDMPSENLLQYFDEGHAFIDEGIQNGGTLVHCAAGISRSSTMTISYIMRKTQKPYQHCHDLVRQARTIIQPNAGFEKQLRLFERMGFKVDETNRDYQKFLVREGEFYTSGWW